MVTSSNSTASATYAAKVLSVSEWLRMQLADAPAAGQPDGAWWPRSRDLEREAADLVDHFPASHGRIRRMLFSRPDWDNPIDQGRGVGVIQTARGSVRIGSFPSDDTHLMILTMSSGRRLKLAVIPYDTPAGDAEQRLRAGGKTDATSGGAADVARWDDESPGE
jgi:hypothetical protein